MKFIARDVYLTALLAALLAALAVAALAGGVAAARNYLVWGRATAPRPLYSKLPPGYGDEGTRYGTAPFLRPELRTGPTTEEWLRAGGKPVEGSLGPVRPE